MSPAETGWGDEVNANFDVLDDAVLHADFSGSEGFLRKTGSDTYTVMKSNLAASTAPTVNEDSGDGYTIGSIWLDTTADIVYVCLDASAGAAVWHQLSHVEVQKDDASQGNFTTLNFEGDITMVDEGGGVITIAVSGTGGGGGGGGISEVVEDTSPSLGGDLDTAGFTIMDSVENATEFANAAFFGEAELTDGANISWNVGTQPAARVTLAGDRILDDPTNMKAGATYILRVLKTAGTETMDYGDAYLWPSGVAPVLTSGIDILSFYSDGTNMYGAFLGDFR